MNIFFRKIVMVVNSSNYTALNTRAIAVLDELMHELGLATKQVGKELQFINPKRADNDFGSASINTETGVWADFADTDAKGGDLTSFVAWLKGCNQAKAMDLLEGLVTKVENSDQPPIVKSISTRQAERVNAVKHPIPAALAPVPPTKHFKHGVPSKTWSYFDDSGVLVALIYRFDLDGGRKQILPCTLKQSGVEWHWKGLEGQRPLYNLQALIAHPDAPVLIVEGEKSADAAEGLFPDWVCVTTMGGANAPHNTDLTPLQDRKVFIWPDADEPGQKYAERVIRLIYDLNPQINISVMQPIMVNPITQADGKISLKDGFIAPQGWDAADAVEHGWTPEHINLLPATIWQEPIKSEHTKFGSFFITADGLFLERYVDGKRLDDHVASYIKPVALTRNEYGNNWGVLLQVADPEKTIHEWAMPKELLSGGGDACREQLLNLGAKIYFKDKLSTFLMTAEPEARALCTESIGWHGNLNRPVCTRQFQAS